MSYPFTEIEKKWQAFWNDSQTFATPEDSDKPKYYVLDMFPYPSGHGLHVGHLKGYVASDVVARFKRMQGHSVLHPMGWDAFGLPAERQAVRENVHPRELTRRNIDIFRRQLMSVGLSYDWGRELSTTDEDFYRWTQWIFKRLYEKGLAYQADVPVNWCPALNTVLANEEVKDGIYIETGDLVERRTMRQWMLRITAYADRLLEDLDAVDWPESVKEMQRQWIGRSEGTRVRFEVAGNELSFEVFTTRADTLFGCTYCTLAPEHPLIETIVSEAQRPAVEAYVREAQNRSERERMAAAKTKTGAFTGAYAVNPVNGEQVPIWVSDYVLMSFGTGAVFACPAHDQRDYDFATDFGLPIIEVVKGGNVAEAAYPDDGPHRNSGFLDGLNIADARRKITAWLEERGQGKAEVTYRLRDWLFSRQRYWGEPFPVIHTIDGQTKTVADDRLPVRLPHIDDFQDTKGALAPLGGVTDWLNTTDPETGLSAQYDSNTMPQWAGSSWYFLRFCDPHNQNEAWSRRNESYWMPVDLYVGGVEHATLHLLYARFWHKFLYDEGLVSTAEPFKKLFNQGMITARSFRDSRGRYYYPNEVIQVGEDYVTKDGRLPLETQIEKMSKSRYNVVTPDEIIEQYGADTLRLFEAFLGPIEKGGIWQTENIVGVHRFLERVHAMFSPPAVADEAPEGLVRLMHKTIKKVTDDIDSLNLNTAISQLMILLAELSKAEALPPWIYEALAKLIAPLAPHLAEECWAAIGGTGSVALAPWPAYEPALAEDRLAAIAVQVLGKVRGVLEADMNADREAVEAAAREVPGVKRHLEGKVITKVIYVPNKIVNFIVRDA